jgi:hypothetical protein
MAVITSQGTAGLTKWLLVGVLSWPMLSASPMALAGPPFVSDDPELTDAGHWEVYNFVAGTRLNGSESGQAGFDINYGAAPDLQLTAVLPIDYSSASGQGAAAGDIQLALKLRFVHQSDDSWLPDIALFPRLYVPNGSRRFETGEASLFLPLWLQKDSGPWSYFGGGGYQLNGGAGRRNFSLFGAALERRFSDELLLGAEIYHQTGTLDQALAYSALNLGLTYQINPHLALLGAAGPGIQNASQLGRFNFYAALDVTW